MSEDKRVFVDYSRMRDQIFRETSGVATAGGVRPEISFEKGTALVSFQLPSIGERLLFKVIELMKSHLDNIRVHALGEGFYAFQAMNSNLFKTENMLDNYKVEFFAITGAPRVDISKKGNLTQEEVNLTIAIFRLFYSAGEESPAETLAKLGASVFTEHEGYTWDIIAGYENVKKTIRESVILPLKHPEMYDSIAKLTRRKFESNRPKAILFDGPPGVGKTTVARVIAGEAGVPLVYMPVESIMSKWYGQSSQNLSQIFDLCEDLGGAILFIDEIDSLAGSRDSGMFEATRRILSVLLRKLDGIGSVENTLTIGATNRKDDLDRALISRFDQTIFFPLPDANERAAIFSCYAKHLSEEECSEIGKAAESLSGRNIKDLCEFTERRWAGKLIQKELTVRAPAFDFYKNSVTRWMDDLK
jgi:ATP-dependent Zn protease